MCRTMSLPVRAVDFQCTRRRSSPTTYSRNRWKVRLPWGAMSDVGPSAGRENPAGSGRNGRMRGYTHNSSATPNARVRFTRPNGS